MGSPSNVRTCGKRLSFLWNKKISSTIPSQAHDMPLLTDTTNLQRSSTLRTAHTLTCVFECVCYTLFCGVILRHTYKRVDCEKLSMGRQYNVNAHLCFCKTKITKSVELSKAMRCGALFFLLLSSHQDEFSRTTRS